MGDIDSISFLIDSIVLGFFAMPQAYSLSRKGKIRSQ